MVTFASTQKWHVPIFSQIRQLLTFLEQKVCFLQNCLCPQLQQTFSLCPVKVWPYKRLIIYCNKSLSWEFIGEVSEEQNAFINLANLLFYVGIVNEIFIKMQPNMFLNNSLGDYFYTRSKNHFLCLFWGISIKRLIQCVSQITLTLSRSLLNCDAQSVLFWSAEKTDVSTAKSFTKYEIPSDKSFI